MQFVKISVVKATPCFRFAFMTRQFFQLKKVSELQFQLKKQEIEYQLKLQESEYQLKFQKQEAEYQLKLQKITLNAEIEKLEYKLQIACLELIRRSASYSIFAAVECLITISQSTKPGITEKLKAEYNSNVKFQTEFKALCDRFNCVSDSEKVLENLYQALSTLVQSRGIPICLYMSDSTLSDAQWAFVIALFKFRLPSGSFEVFDKDDINITREIYALK